MSRLQRKIKYLNRTWTVNSLVPADFLSVSYWPFAYYRLPEDQATKKQAEAKRDWKLKPTAVLSEEERLALSIKQAFKISLGINFDSEYETIKQNESLFNILLSEIYSITYQLTPTEKIFEPFKIISRDFAESLAIKAKAMGIEPYAFMADIFEDKPELYNPKRFDFNWFILGVGWDKERREIEKQNAAIRSKANLRKRQ